MCEFFLDHALARRRLLNFDKLIDLTYFWHKSTLCVEVQQHISQTKNSVIGTKVHTIWELEKLWLVFDNF